MPVKTNFADEADRGLFLIENHARDRLRSNPDDDRALRQLSISLNGQGKSEEAEVAARQAAISTMQCADVVEAVAALNRNDFAEAEVIIRSRLREDPQDFIALLMMGDLTHRLGILDASEDFLRQSVALAPAIEDSWQLLGQVLHEGGNTAEAISCFDDAQRRADDPSRALSAKIGALCDVGNYDEALAVHRSHLEVAGDLAGTWVAFGNTLKTVGQRTEAIAAYRRGLALDPGCVEAWWSLSNLKVGAIADNDIVALDRLAHIEHEARRNVYIHFALGKAHEDRADYGRSFDHYARANAARRSIVPHDRDALERRVDDLIRVFDANLFERHAGSGNPSADAIFIVGMPRSGSTLLEQILASHPAVEGTAELPIMPAMVRGLLAQRWQDPTARYPDLVSTLSADDLAGIGTHYLRNAARHRKSNAPQFIDKMPINWMHVGLIRLVLPNATIIDARRDAMSCCFANFKQHFPGGQSQAYDLADLGHQYRQYIRLMDNFEAVVPGKVIRVQHETLIDHPETSIRGLLDAIGLPFAESCLRFYDNDRPVRTPSAEQVRRPINRDAVGLWRRYEPWLDDLKSALGPLASD